MQSIHLFSNAISNWDLHLRCISIISILESIFTIESETYKIEEKVKPRLSKVLSDNNLEKEKIKSVFSDIYIIRHKMIHKAIRLPIDKFTLASAQKLMVLLFVELIKLSSDNGINTKTELIEKLNKIKS